MPKLTITATINRDSVSREFETRAQYFFESQQKIYSDYIKWAIENKKIPSIDSGNEFLNSYQLNDKLFRERSKYYSNEFVHAAFEYANKGLKVYRKESQGYKYEIPFSTTDMIDKEENLINGEVPRIWLIYDNGTTQFKGYNSVQIDQLPAVEMTYPVIDPFLLDNAKKVIVRRSKYGNWYVSFQVYLPTEKQLTKMFTRTEKVKHGSYATLYREGVIGLGYNQNNLLVSYDGERYVTYSDQRLRSIMMNSNPTLNRILLAKMRFTMNRSILQIADRADLHLADELLEYGNNIAISILARNVGAIVYCTIRNDKGFQFNINDPTMALGVVRQRIFRTISQHATGAMIDFYAVGNYNDKIPTTSFAEARSAYETYINYQTDTPAMAVDTDGNISLDRLLI